MAESSQSNDATEWQREKRVQVYNSVRRARYPSIIKSADGVLMVLFTRQTEDQENAQRGDLVLVRSTDAGQSWSEDQVVFEAKLGEPRAVGTMTRLADDRIIAPFAELSEDPTKSIVRILHRDANANDWQVSDVRADCPFVWWAPCGRVIEDSDGTLTMPVYGATTPDQLSATIHGCGLLRSPDHGQSWGDFSWIVQGPDHVIGAAPDRKFSFQGLSVEVLSNSEQWLVVLTARRLNKAGDGPSPPNEGPGAPQILVRLWSRDQGRTWTKPDQLTPGAWPTLARVGPHMICVNTLWCGWGEMGLLASNNGFRSFFQELLMMNRGWTKGRVNKPEEAPLPPTVPNLADAWPFEHYGYPSAVALDDEHLIVVFARTQWGTPSYHEFNPKEEDDIPIEKERIQSVFFKRVPIQEQLVPPRAAKPKRPRGRWVLVERMVIDGFGPSAQMPNGDLVGRVFDKIQRSSDGGRTWREVEGAKLPNDLNAFGVLESGRWLAACSVYHGKGNDPKDWGKTTEMGVVGGYPIRKHSGVQDDYSTVVNYSDDEGKIWRTGTPFKGVFQWALPTVSHFLECPDGTIALPIMGCVTPQENDSYSASNGVIRSTDGGQTWGDFSFIFRTQPPGPNDHQYEPRYSEMDIVQVPKPDDRETWVAYSRSERIGGGPDHRGTEVAVSDDFGRTWQRTGGSIRGVSQQKGVVLPNGGIALTSRCTSWQAPGVVITYDEGRSFDYQLTGPYETSNAFLTGDNEFIVLTGGKSYRSDAAAAVYKWIPDNSRD